MRTFNLYQPNDEVFTMKVRMTEEEQIWLDNWLDNNDQIIRNYENNFKDYE